MTLKIGSNSVNKLYLGSTEVKRAYQGSTLVYSKVPVEATYITNATDTVNSPTHTFNGIQLGANHPDKQALIFVASYSGLGSGATNVVIAGVTAAPQVTAASGEGVIQVGFYLASGTVIQTTGSANMTVTYGGNTAFCQMAVTKVLNALPRAVSTASDNTLAANAFNFSMTGPTNGAIVVGQAIYSLTTPNVTWTNATERWESTGGRADYVGGGASTTSTGSISITATNNAASGAAGAMIGVAFATP